MYAFRERGDGNVWKKIIAAVGCSVLLLGGNPADAAEQQQDVMWAYREAYMANINDERVASTNIDLFGPNYHWELDADGKVLRDGSMRWHGNMSWDYTEKKSNITSHEDIPFYLEHLNNMVTLYIQRENNWSKISVPGVPPELANALASNSINYFNDSMQAVKKVTIENETDKMRGFRVVMDAGKMMQVTEKYWDTAPNNLSEKEKQEQKEFFANLTKSFAGTELTFDWVVNKENNKTVTLSTDLTPLLRAYARNVINEMSAGNVKLTDEQREMMDALGYFSELKFYVTYVGANQEESLAVPDDVRKNAVDMLNIADIQKGVSEAAQTEKK